MPFDVICKGGYTPGVLSDVLILMILNDNVHVRQQAAEGWLAVQGVRRADVSWHCRAKLEGNAG